MKKVSAVGSLQSSADGLSSADERVLPVRHRPDPPYHEALFRAARLAVKADQKGDLSAACCLSWRSASVPES